MAVENNRGEKNGENPFRENDSKGKIPNHKRRSNAEWQIIASLYTAIVAFTQNSRRVQLPEGLIEKRCFLEKPHGNIREEKVN